MKYSGRSPSEMVTSAVVNDTASSVKFVCLTQRTYRTTKKNSRNMKSSRKGGQLSVKRELSDGPAYSGQQRVVLQLEGGASLVSTTITTGVIASAYPISSNAITGFATRFGSTFDEYRILKARFRITPVSPSTGVSKMWFDEKSSAAPTVNESNERTALALPNTNANSKSKQSMIWVARDLLDLEYLPIGTVSVVAYHKIYTDTGNWAAPTAVTPLWIIEPIITVEFRGIKST